MTQLILKRGNASRASGQWKDEDYDVLADGKVIGRIMEEGSRFGAAGAAVGMVDHRDRAGVTCHAWHRRDPRRGDGEVSRRLGEGALLRLKLFFINEPPSGAFETLPDPPHQ
jgi:hypothetical protein